MLQISSSLRLKSQIELNINLSRVNTLTNRVNLSQNSKIHVQCTDIYC